MHLEIKQLQNSLCKSFCADIQLIPKNEDLLLIETPFYFPDGDPYQIYLKEHSAGSLMLTDMGHTLMHLSYENDIDKYREGTRGQLFDKILSELDIKEKDGQFYIITTPGEVSKSIFRFGQALTKIYDLTFLNRVRVQATFYDDLKEELYRYIPAEKIHPDFVYSNIENAQDYPIDYLIEGKIAPLYVFGIPNRDKAKLTTIVLERLLRAKADFESIMIFADQTQIPRADLSRLSNAGGEMIASLDAKDDLRRKLLRRVA
ncbi:DUF1828 domain-containing protein [Parafilimonas sp.]|uniref:DUF1828 domain-containing protein n=1 Tax=Parafilimonas sp. TaxID=1969739 RepID=UPI003F7DCE09